MEIRNLGSSGLKISAIAYGNWLTHGSQVEEDAATACVRQALDEGITTFDTADVYANTTRRDGARQGAAGRAPRGPGDLHQGLLADRPGQAQRPRPVAQAHHGVDQRLAAAGSAPTTSTSTRRTATTTRRRSRRRWRPSPTSCTPARRSTSASRSGGPRRSGRRTRWPASCAIPLVSNQPQYTMLWRVIEAEVVPTCEELGIGQIVWSPIAQGVLTGKYKPGEQPPRGLARHRRQGRRGHDQRAGSNDDVLERVQQLAADRRRGRPDAWPSSRSPGCCRTPTSPRRSSAPPGPSRSPRTSRRPA